MVDVNDRAVEQAVLLGARKSLVGIVTPASPGAPSTAPLAVILNAGIVHRAGPNRMSVALARSLAAAGCTTLRFDLSGVGDSDPRNDGLAPFEAALADIKEAIDWLDPAGRARAVVLIGLCSGADHAAVYAGRDTRVAGAVLIDPSVPRTRGFYLRDYLRRALRVRRWLKAVRRARPVVQPEAESDQATEVLPDPTPSLQDTEVRAYLDGAYRATVGNGNQLLAVFTGGRESEYNYRKQFLDAFPDIPFGERLRLEYLPQADHTFDSETERDRLIELIVEWARSTVFGAVLGLIRFGGLFDYAA